MRRPSLNLGVAAKSGERYLLPPLLEAIRLDQEPSSNGGRGESLWGFESLRFRSGRHPKEARSHPGKVVRSQGRCGGSTHAFRQGPVVFVLESDDDVGTQF